MLPTHYCFSYIYIYIFILAAEWIQTIWKVKLNKSRTNGTYKTINCKLVYQFQLKTDRFWGSCPHQQLSTEIFTKPKQIIHWFQFPKDQIIFASNIECDLYRRPIMPQSGLSILASKSQNFSASPSRSLTTSYRNQRNDPKIWLSTLVVANILWRIYCIYSFRKKFKSVYKLNYLFC